MTKISGTLGTLQLQLQTLAHGTFTDIVSIDDSLTPSLASTSILDDRGDGSQTGGTDAAAVSPPSSSRSLSPPAFSNLPFTLLSSSLFRPFLFSYHNKDGYRLRPT